MYKRRIHGRVWTAELRKGRLVVNGIERETDEAVLTRKDTGYSTAYVSVFTPRQGLRFLACALRNLRRGFSVHTAGNTPHTPRHI